MERKAVYVGPSRAFEASGQSGRRPFTARPVTTRGFNQSPITGSFEVQVSQQPHISHKQTHRMPLDCEDDVRSNDLYVKISAT